MTSQRLSLDIGPVGGVVDGWVEPVERHDEIERPVLSAEHTSNVVADTVEVRYLNATAKYTMYRVAQNSETTFFDCSNFLKKIDTDYNYLNKQTNN